MKIKRILYGLCLILLTLVIGYFWCKFLMFDRGKFAVGGEFIVICAVIGFTIYYMLKKENNQNDRMRCGK